MKLLEQKGYRDLVVKQVKEQILYLLKSNTEFSIVVNMDSGIDFKPILPEEITSQFKEFTIFAIAGYTFKSAFVKDDTFIFEAGFGPDNIGAMVYVDLDRIIQVVIGETPIFLNLVASQPRQTYKDSFDVFAKNPKNSKFFKNKKK